MLLETTNIVFCAVFSYYFIKNLNKSPETLNYLVSNHTCKDLLGYIKSYTFDSKVLKKLKNKTDLARFIILTTLKPYNAKKCDICYNQNDSVRVHKCQRCTFFVCMTCLNMLDIPTKCPQCSVTFYFHEMTNNVVLFSSLDQWNNYRSFFFKAFIFCAFFYFLSDFLNSNVLFFLYKEIKNGHK